MIRTFTSSLLICLLCTHGTQGQQTNEHQKWRTQYKTAIKNADSLDMARSLRKLGILFIYESKIDSARTHLQKALEIAQKLANHKATGAIYNNLAECESKNGLHQAALNYYSQAIKSFEQTGDTSAMAGIYINMAAVYAETGQYKQAIETNIEAIKLKEQINDSAHLAFFYNQLAEQFEKHDSTKWETYLKTAARLSRTPAYTTFYTNIAIYNNLGELALSKNKLDEAFQYFDTLYNIAVEHNHYDGKEVGLSNKAHILVQQGQTQQAQKLYRQAIDAANNSENIYRKIGTYINAARLESSFKAYNNAIKLLEKACKWAHQYNYPKMRMRALNDLIAVHEALNQWQKAHTALNLYTHLKDSIESYDMKVFLQEIETRYQTEKKEQQIKLLASENEWNKKHSRTLTILFIISGLLLAILGVMTYFRISYLKQQRKIADQRNEIYQLNQEKLRLTIDNKSRELTSMAMQIAQKNEFLTELKKHIETKTDPTALKRNIESHMAQQTEWDGFKLRFNEVHPGFLANLKMKHPNITANEERLCAFIVLNLSTKEIAQMLHNTTAAVDKSRNRLRKKLDLMPEDNLKTYLEQFVNKFGHL